MPALLKLTQNQIDEANREHRKHIMLSQIECRQAEAEGCLHSGENWQEHYRRDMEFVLQYLKIPVGFDNLDEKKEGKSAAWKEGYEAGFDEARREVIAAVESI